jgi:hypothetical protein
MKSTFRRYRAGFTLLAAATVLVSLMGGSSAQARVVADTGHAPASWPASDAAPLSVGSFRTLTAVQAASGKLTGCGTTYRLASNLYMAKCLIDWRPAGIGNYFSAAVTVYVSAGASHYVGVPGMYAVKNGNYYSPTSCPTSRVDPGVRKTCVTTPATSFSPGHDFEQGYSRFDHDGIAGSWTYSPSQKL